MAINRVDVIVASTLSELTAYTPSGNYAIQGGHAGFCIDTQLHYNHINGAWVENSSSGISDGDKGDVTVSSSGAVWTIDNLAITNAKINDVDATKVITDSSNRFVTDAQKTIINNTSGTNSGDNAVNTLYSGLATSKQDTFRFPKALMTSAQDETLAGGYGTIIPYLYKVGGGYTLTIGLNSNFKIV